MLTETKRKQNEAREPSSLVDVTRTLEEARDALRNYEVAALVGIAATLAEATESLSHTAGELREMSREEWMTPDQAARLPRVPIGRRLRARGRQGRDSKALSLRQAPPLLSLRARCLTLASLVILQGGLPPVISPAPGLRSTALTCARLPLIAPISAIEWARVSPNGPE